jgi:hypothetical protein
VASDSAEKDLEDALSGWVGSGPEGTATTTTTARPISRESALGAVSLVVENVKSSLLGAPPSEPFNPDQVQDFFRI